METKAENKKIIGFSPSFFEWRKYFLDLAKVKAAGT